jgi:L-amino acid N-acyltransferase YncA
MDKFIVRAILREDLDRLVLLCAEHAAYECAEYSPEGKAERLEKLLFGAPPRIMGALVEEAGVLVGYATWSREASTWDATEYMHVDCMYLREDARAAGAAVALIKQMAVEFREAGLNEVTAQWQTPPFNENAIRFYEALGGKRKDKARFYMDGPTQKRLARWADRDGFMPWYPRLSD